jgi:hypothetical protein
VFEAVGAFYVIRWIIAGFKGNERPANSKSRE